jgi:hypothetical protein
MAEHYQTVIMPARIRHPKDKPNVEGAVGVISTWIVASLRNQQFFSITELNKAIREKLAEYNEKPFQKKSGSRLSSFLEEEKFALLPLPAPAFELATWKKATVQYDYHILVDKMYYSVPYEYIKHQVDVRINKKMIEIFFNNFRIASHIRLYGKEGQPSTMPEHMPDHHKQYLQYSREYFFKWSDSVGFHTHSVVRGIFLSYKVEKQAIKSCMALSKLADKYSLTRLESACRRALEYAQKPNVNMIKTILQTGQDKYEIETVNQENEIKDQKSSHSFTRGAEYYGRKEK